MRKGNYNELDIDTNQRFTFRNESASKQMNVRVNGGEEIEIEIKYEKKTCYQKISQNPKT